MSKGRSKKKKGNRNGRKPSACRALTSHFVSEAAPGCCIARKDLPQPKWMIGWEDDIDPADFDGQEVPQIALDPEDSTLTLCNIQSSTQVCYVTVYDVNVRDKDGRVLVSGTTTDNNGDTRDCVTFVVLCPPMTFAHLCHLDIPENKSILDIEIDSDVQDWNQHPSPYDTHPRLLDFPLGSTGSPFLCTQCEQGQLTHFFSGNLHAIDFRCNVGTPILAVGDGVVVQIKDDNTLTGIAVGNLFKWNSVTLELDEIEEQPLNKSATKNENIKGGPLFVEYVHIQANSAKVKVGDRVESGQVICHSGSVGFSPEPHLHFAAYRSAEPTAPTVRVRFRSRGEEGKNFLPKAGVSYDATGPIENGNI